MVRAVPLAWVPVLESAVTARAGKVELAKLDVDANQSLAQRYGVQGIPAVKAFRNGELASEFTGAAPPAQVERFIDALVPSEAEELATAAAASGDEEGLRRAVELDPRQAGAAAHLAHLLLRRGEAEEALKVVEPWRARTSYVRVSPRGHGFSSKAERTRRPTPSPPSTKATPNADWSYFRKRSARRRPPTAATCCAA